ncbi:unnamed protein product [Brassicogethes aeneus]|uniref:Uncharacterized protein n=1 Tax=Brassicogethes aeneus TaxID=1431903 RepID=A0A9P0FN69_BRAAE|nr:unnamed protein product [Brassicogethes aeneus]
MLEAVFYDTGCEIHLFTQKNNNNTNNKKGRTEAIIIESKNTTYAETLKKIKENLTDTDMIKQINRAKSTTKGDPLISLSNTAEGKTIKEKIETIVRGEQKVRLLDGNKQMTIHIHGIDDVSTI